MEANGSVHEKNVLRENAVFWKKNGALERTRTFTPHSWYMLAFQNDDSFYKDLNSSLVSASYDLCWSKSPGTRKYCRETMRQWWYQAYENYHDTQMDIH